MFIQNFMKISQKFIWRSMIFSLCFLTAFMALPWGVRPVRADTATAAISAGTNPMAVAVNPATNKVYVANGGSNDVTVIDGATNATTTVTAGTGPQAVAVNPATNKVYVANYASNNVTVIDGATNATTTVAAGTHPRAVAVNPATNQIYVANFVSSNVTVIDEQPQQNINPVTTINSLSNNVTTSSAVTLNISATTLAPLPVQQIYYQVDTISGQWLNASPAGNDASATLTALQPGTHILYAMATDGFDATCINTGLGYGVQTGKIAAYAFTYTPEYTVIYNGNGQDGGNVPIDNNAYAPDSSINVLGNTGNLTRTGCTFAGWNTAADGSGISYGDGDRFKMDMGNVTLYAQWAGNNYTVTYDGNGNTGGAVPATVTSYVYGQTVTVSGNIGSPPLIKTGDAFAGWNTAADGSGTSYSAGDTFNMGAADATLYAQWAGNNYTVTYDGNGNTGGAVPTTVTSYVYGQTVTVSGNIGSPPLSKTGDAFAGWNTAADGSGTSYSAGDTFNMGAADATLYAQWAANSHDRGGGGSYTPPPTSTTVTGSVINGTNGAQMSNITATVTTDSNGNSTVSMQAADVVTLKGPDGTGGSMVSDLSKLALTSVGGSPITVAADGTLSVGNMAEGTDNTYDIVYDLGNGQKIVVGTMEIKIDSSGNVTLTITLIDPYGIITDAATGKSIAGAKVTLYYANTERNKANGKTPDTVVTLPGIPGFKPNNNQDPQTSDVNGAYGFMVFPDTDYYIVASKDGYNQYTSPTISVGQEIVHWDFKMNPVTFGVTRLAGQSRVDTALAIALAEYSGKIENVVLATADNYPDALAGSVLAYKENAPILLVGSTEAEQAKVLAYLKSNLDSAGTVYILGGTGAVSADLEAQIQAEGFKNITRIAGADRYATSAKIADQLGVKTGTPVVLVSGENYPDALSVSSVAAEMQLPILLVENDGLSASVSQEITALKPSKVYIIGGEGVISPALENQVAQLTGLAQADIVRIGGADRYATSLDVAQYFNLGNQICVATGSNFPDALAGSVYAAKYNAAIILADGSLPAQTVNYLKSKNLTGATIFGGEAVVSTGIEQQLQQLIGQ